MKHLLTATVIALGMSGAAWAQEGGEKRREGKSAAEPTVTLKEIDTNKDGKLTIAELQAAIERLMKQKEAAGEKKEGANRREGADRKEGGDKKKD